MDRKEKKLLLEAQRVKNAQALLTKSGIAFTMQNPVNIIINHDGHQISFWPYTGWHSGKSITAGRGIKNLIKQLSDETKKMSTLQRV